MKANHLLITIVSMIFTGFPGQAKTILYKADFSSAPTGVTGAGWQIATNSPSNYNSASGGNYCISQTPIITTTYTMSLENNISTVGYKNVTVSWGGKRSGGNPVSLYYATGNDANGDNIEDFTQVQGFSDAGNNWDLVSVELPVAGMNNLKLRWSYTSSFLNLLGFTTYAVDDIVISADLDPVITPLPVTLLSFTGQYENNHVLLQWQTATEVNNEFFEVQRSLDGKEFNYVTEMKGAFNSNKVIAYSFKDKVITDNVFYYRLKQIDFNGNISFSPTIKVKALKQGMNLLTVFPNPTNNYLQLQFPKEVKEFCQFEIVNQGGTIIRFSFDKTPAFINIEDLASGIYLLKATGKEISYTGRFLKN